MPSLPCRRRKRTRRRNRGTDHAHFALQEKEENKKLKQKQRDRMQPKVGKLDIDYQVLHDAFFKHQTKPNLTRLGEIYYEGKEFEARVRGHHPACWLSLASTASACIVTHCMSSL